MKKFLKYFLRPNIEPPDWVPLPRLWEQASSFVKPSIAMLWIYGYYVRLFTVPGRLIIAATIVVALYSLILFHTPVLILTFALFGVLISDFIVGYIFKPKLLISRTLPERVRVGSSFKIRYI
jgi:hypothetical protein